jgi:hypothetical protein
MAATAATVTLNEGALLAIQPHADPFPELDPLGDL